MAGGLNGVQNDSRSVGLPTRIRACLFDLDGVLVCADHLHAAAWAETLDEFLKNRTTGSADNFRAFDTSSDYREHLAGRPRREGVRSFLQSRGIELPEGCADEGPPADTVLSLATRKDQRLLARIRQHGVETHRGSIRYVEAVRRVGLASAVISAAPHAREVLEAAGIAHLFDERLDGIDAENMHLNGKPAPDVLLAAARTLWILPAEAAVFDATPAGIVAARAGSFGHIIGLDRVGQPQDLRDRGADIVVRDLAQLLQLT